MELKYRGISYRQSADNQIKTRESRITARFLGRTYLIRRYNELIASYQFGLCKYRGINY